MIVWVIHKPGYGMSDGLPEEIWTSRAGARERVRELNAPWHYTIERHRKNRLHLRIVPYRLRRMETAP